MAGRILEGGESVRGPATAAAAPGSNCSRGADNTSEQERGRVSEETSHAVSLLTHLGGFLSCRFGHNSAPEKAFPLTLAARERRVK